LQALSRARKPEIREDGKRVGFNVDEFGGLSSTLLAHVALSNGPQVGRYRVDVAAFEGLAVPAVERAIQRADVAIIDELGRMELLSPAFVDSFEQLLDHAIPLVATIHSRPDPITDAIKRRPDIELHEVHPGEVDKLCTHLVSRLTT